MKNTLLSLMFFGCCLLSTYALADSTTKQCVKDANNSRRTCISACQAERKDAVATCKNNDPACVTRCRSNYRACEEPLENQLEDCSEACGPTFETAKLACRASCNCKGSACERSECYVDCIRPALLARFSCRTTCKENYNLNEEIQNALKACGDAKKACLLTCDLGL